MGAAEGAGTQQTPSRGGVPPGGPGVHGSPGPSSLAARPALSWAILPAHWCVTILGGHGCYRGKRNPRNHVTSSRGGIFLQTKPSVRSPCPSSPMRGQARGAGPIPGLSQPPDVSGEDRGLRARAPLPVCSGFRFLERLCQFGSGYKRKARPSSKTARQEMHMKQAWADSLRRVEHLPSASEATSSHRAPPPPRSCGSQVGPREAALLLSCWGQRAGGTGVHTLLRRRQGLSLAFVSSR